MASPPHKPSPANRLRIDYRRVPPRKLNVPITDVHTHVRGVAQARLFVEVARLYGVSRIVSMTPLIEVDAMRAAFGDLIRFIAVPDWSRDSSSAEFHRSWAADLATFREKGARVCKFWMAPRMRERHGFTLDHPFIRPVIRHAYELGYHFMVHVADPTVWWNTQYADTSVFGTKRDQYPQLEWLLEEYPDRIVIAAHMGGNVEEPDFLEGLLDRYPNLRLDSSATKWIAREVAARPDAVRELIIRRSDRILFGTDVVVAPGFDFDHYASRYWTHLQMWETAYRGESPIEDPDAPTPRLAGLDLPPDVLQKLYCDNYERLFADEPA